MLIFNHEEHKYYYNGEEFISATTVIDKYKNTFDTDFWSTFKALERIIGKEEFRKMREYKNFKSPQFIEWACTFVNTKELIKVIATIKKEWEKERDDSLFKGTAYHNRKEKQAYEKGYEVNPFTDTKFPTATKKPIGQPKSSGIKDLSTLNPGYYPELRLWNEQFKIAGTADKVFIDRDIDTGQKLVYIDDYKTNKEIKKSNMWDKMKSPLNRLDDCNYQHYRLQVCLYAWMLEEKGFKVKATSFTHFNYVYKVSYPHTRKHIINMLNHYESVRIRNNTK